MLHAGIELTRATGRALLLEYSVGLPVVNDPGDFYGFATNHFFSIAFRTGRGSLYSRGLDPHPAPDATIRAGLRTPASRSRAKRESAAT